MCKSLISYFLVAVFFLIFCLGSAIDCEAKNCPLKIKFDKKKGGSIYISTMKISFNVGSFFKIQMFDLKKFITLTGPFRGNFKETLKQIGGTRFYIRGKNHYNDIQYNLSLKKISNSKVLLSFFIQIKKGVGRVTFHLLELNSLLFPHLSVSSESNLKAIRPKFVKKQPLSNQSRFSLKKKKYVILNSDFFLISVKSLTEDSYINLVYPKGGTSKILLLYSSIKEIIPGKRYYFKYEIEIKVNNVSVSVKKKPNQIVTTNNLEQNHINPFRYFKPKFKKISKKSGVFKLGTKIYIKGDNYSSAVKILYKILTEFFNLNVSIIDNKHQMNKIKNRKIIVFKPLSSNCILPSREGYEINITPSKVIIRAKTERGAIYGAYSFISLLCFKKGQWFTPCVWIQDWPDLKIRGIIVESNRNLSGDCYYFKRFLLAASIARANTIIFYHYPRQVKAWIDGKELPGRFTKSQMKEISEYARFLKMNVWCGMSTKFKKRFFPHLPLCKECNIYDPTNPLSYKIVFSLCDYLIQLYHPSHFLIGHDEVIGLSYYQHNSSISTAKILANDIIILTKYFQKKGIKVFIWGDMLLDYNKWENVVGHAHSGLPFFKSGNTWQAIKYIPKDIGIIDWHYSVKKDYPSLKYFVKKNFSVFGCSWYLPKNAEIMAKSVKRYGAKGVFVTTWGLFSTLSPLSTTLYGPFCGWNTQVKIDNKNMNDVKFLAFILRRQIYNKYKYFKQFPVPLNQVYNASTIDTKICDSEGLFDLGPIIDLRDIPYGLKKYGGINFWIPYSKSSKRKNCIIIFQKACKFSSKKKSIFIPINKKATAIAFLHTCFLEDPAYDPIILGKYIIKYKNGEKREVFLRQEFNISDIRTGSWIRGCIKGFSFKRDSAILIGAKLGWEGSSYIGIPLSLQVYIWTNPYPEKTIRSIQIQTLNIGQDFYFCLLGLTLLTDITQKR